MDQVIDGVQHHCYLILLISAQLAVQLLGVACVAVVHRCSLRYGLVPSAVRGDGSFDFVLPAVLLLLLLLLPAVAPPAKPCTPAAAAP